MRSEPTPHRSVYSENNLETVWFNFSDKDSFPVDNLERDIEFTIYNGAYSSLSIDYQANVQRFSDGWVDIGHIDLEYNEQAPHIIIEEEIENMEGMVNLSQLDYDFVPGRYRLIITVNVTDEDSDLSGQQTIGKIFWLEE